MGVFSEYLGRRMDHQALMAERKKELTRISKARRGRDVLVIAADMTKASKTINVALDYSDILPVQDQLSILTGKEIDILLETPGGLAEVAEDIVNLIRAKYERVAMIVPGWAKSAGTIFTMAGDEILMGPTSALGPIDPQIGFTMGRRFSADAFLEGLDKIKEEVAKSGTLNPAYIPILQNISPGEIQNCINARLFSQKLVREWLVEYKFKYWEKHTSTGKEVTHDEKVKRAGEIAEALCDHSRWLTHNRSINMVALEQLGLKIEDYTKDPDLNDAITRYYTLLKMSFDMANIYKVFETPTSQVMRIVATIAPPATKKQVGCADANFKCPKCGKAHKIQANLGQHFDLKPGRVMYPLDTNVLKCDNCGTENDLLPIRLQLEARSGTKVVP